MWRVHHDSELLFCGIYQGKAEWHYVPGHIRREFSLISQHTESRESIHKKADSQYNSKGLAWPSQCPHFNPVGNLWRIEIARDPHNLEEIEENLPRGIDHI